MEALLSKTTGIRFGTEVCVHPGNELRHGVVVVSETSGASRMVVMVKKARSK